MIRQNIYAVVIESYLDILWFITHVSGGFEGYEPGTKLNRTCLHPCPRLLSILANAVILGQAGALPFSRFGGPQPLRYRVT